LADEPTENLESKSKKGSGQAFRPSKARAAYDRDHRYHDDRVAMEIGIVLHMQNGKPLTNMEHESEDNEDED
jgi:hypothetical protein